MSTLAGFTSRCTSPALWAASSAAPTRSTITTARSGGRDPSEAISERPSRPSTQRMAMNSRPSDSPASYTGITLGWSIDAARRDSRLKRARKSTSSARSGMITLSATGRSSAIWVARRTTPIPPWPATSSMRYPAKTEPGERSAIGSFIPPPGRGPAGAGGLTRRSGEVCLARPNHNRLPPAEVAHGDLPAGDPRSGCRRSGRSRPRSVPRTVAEELRPRVRKRPVALPRVRRIEREADERAWPRRLPRAGLRHELKLAPFIRSSVRPPVAAAGGTAAPGRPPRRNWPDWVLPAASRALAISHGALARVQQRPDRDLARHGSGGRTDGP